MAYGVQKLSKIQIGAEATAGTIVAATKVLRATGFIKDTRNVVRPPENVGRLSSLNRQYTSLLGGKLALVARPATFEEFPYVLEASMKLIAGAADGAGSSGYKYIFPMPQASVLTTQTYTIEGGDNNAAEVMNFCYVPSWKLSGGGGAALMEESTWNGQQVALQAFTGALVPVSVEEILFLKGKMFVDAVGGTMGTTQITGSFMDFNCTYTSGIMPVISADGNIYYTALKSVGPSMTFQVTFEHDASGSAQKVNWRAGTNKLVRFQWGGNAYGTAGSGTLNSALKTLRMDCCLAVDDVSEIKSANGNNQVTVNLTAVDNLTAAIAPATITVTNELSALV